MSHPAGWSLVRVRERTKELLREEAEWRQEAYEAGRSRRPIAGEQVTLDEVLYEALQYVRKERERKNAYRRPRLAQSQSEGALYTNQV